MHGHRQVSQQVGNLLNGGTVLQEEARSGVPELVGEDAMQPGSSGDASQGLAQVRRVERRAHGRREHEALI